MDSRRQTPDQRALGLQYCMLLGSLLSVLQMNAEGSTKEDHQARSESVRRLVQNARVFNDDSACLGTRPPKRIVQFWDDATRLPADVKACIESWHPLEELGIDRVLFNAGEAKEFIRRELGRRHEEAYSRCYHPAMQSDYFRLCYIYVEGGCYVDADDVYRGASIDHLFDDGRLKVQPLCYDTSTDEMVRPSVFLQPGAGSASWIFYFNNNPLVAHRAHPIIGRALEAATKALERAKPNELPEIQSTTGPGILTKSIVEHAREVGGIADALVVLHRWEDISVSQWPLSYRSDARNWRLSNQQRQPGHQRDGGAGEPQ